MIACPRRCWTNFVARRVLAAGVAGEIALAEMCRMLSPAGLQLIVEIGGGDVERESSSRRRFSMVACYYREHGNLLSETIFR